MTYVIIAIGVVGASAAGAVWWYSQSAGGAGPEPAAPKKGAAEAAKSDSDDEAVAVEQTKLAIKGLLDILSHSVSIFIDQSEAYDEKIDKRREELRTAVTLKSIKAIEEAVLGNLKDLQEANSDYRRQLSEAQEQLKKQELEMAKMQVDIGTDFLTGLPNRRALEERLAENVDRSNRYGTKFSLIILDIDHFKEVNDSHGHMAGDRVLRALANLLAEQMRSSDFLGRYGGEEFVAILPETGDEQALKMAERMRARIEAAQFKFNNEVIKITISGGAGEVYQPEDSSENIFERVDAALYKAKQAGRNTVLATL